MSKLTKALTAAAGNAGGDNLYVEDVFSTYLVTGTNAAVTVNNGLDLDGEGGMVWVKKRSAGGSHDLYDTERGANNRISSNNTNAQDTKPLDFTSTGFSDFYWDSGVDYASWTFRKAEKFFDVVTYTGDGASSRTIAHSLGSVPAFMTVKSSSNVSGWRTYHASLGATQYVQLQTTAAAATYNIWNDTTPTDSVFSISTDVNANGVTYVAYLFASDAGGFGDDGDENIIKCGSYTGNNSADGPTVTLGFEPQWVLIKESDMSGNSWSLYDMMRNGTMDQHLRPNASDAESIAAASPEVLPQATGFKLNTSSGRVNRGSNYIYIAIRRPMKTPESGTEVLSTVAYTGTGADKFLTSSSVVDLAFNKRRTSGDWTWTGRLQGAGRKLVSNGDFSEGTDSSGIKGLDYNNGVLLGTNGDVNGNGDTYISYMLSRATGAFDVVAYTGNGASSQAMAHNLTVAPEFIIVKRRDGNSDWICQVPYTSSPQDYMIKLNTNDAAVNFDDAWRDTAPTATNFTVGSWSYVNTNGGTYIAYLFATLAGVSKVGSVVHSGTTNVDCGFSAGARFVMAKRTDASGDWFIWDSVRGIVSGDDPYVRWNVSSAEVTNTDYIDPLSSGFTLTSSFTAGTYIFLAIA